MIQTSFLDRPEATNLDGLRIQRSLAVVQASGAALALGFAQTQDAALADKLLSSIPITFDSQVIEHESVEVAWRRGRQASTRRPSVADRQTHVLSS